MMFLPLLHSFLLLDILCNDCAEDDMEHNCKNSFYLRENGYIFESYETLMLYVDDFDRLQHTRYEFTYQNLLFGIFKNHEYYARQILLSSDPYKKMSQEELQTRYLFRQPTKFQPKLQAPEGQCLSRLPA